MITNEQIAKLLESEGIDYERALVFLMSLYSIPCEEIAGFRIIKDIFEYNINESTANIMFKGAEIAFEGISPDCENCQLDLNEESNINSIQAHEKFMRVFKLLIRQRHYNLKKEMKRFISDIYKVINNAS